MAAPTYGVAKRIREAPIVDAPAGILEAIWWYMAFHVAPGGKFWRKVRTPQLRRASHRMGLSDPTVQAMVKDTFWAFMKGLRSGASHRLCAKLHPQFEIWYEPALAGLMRRYMVWKAQGKIIMEGGPYPFERDRCAEAFGVSSIRLQGWITAYEKRRISIKVPEYLDWRVRKMRTRERRLAYKAAVDKQRELAQLNEAKEKAASRPAKAGLGGLESNRAGVTRKAADLYREPRKAHFHRKLEGGAWIEGGELIVLSKYLPHAGQVELHDSGARERWVVAGRRGGKTRGGAEDMVRSGLMQRGSYNWVVGPTYPMLDHAQRALLMDTALGYCRELTSLWLKRERKLYLCNGSLIEFRSAEWEESLRGGGLDNIWIDECQLVKKEAYRILRAATLETRGRIVGTGTPLGRNWLFDEWSKGADPDWPDVASWRFPSTLNPLVTVEELERERRGSPSMWFRQEFLAEFVEGVATVFGDLRGCLVNELPQWTVRPSVVLGVDLGKQKDYTAVVCMTSQGQVVDTWRARRESWAKMRERVLQMSHEWGRAPILIDGAGVGDAFAEDLAGAGAYVIPIRTNVAKEKNAAIEQLMIDIEGGRLWIPRSEETLIAELMQYRRSVTPGGNVSYSAPSGFHDDMVIALALANWGNRRLHLAASVAMAAMATDIDEAPSRMGVKDAPARRGLFAQNNATLFGRGNSGGIFRN